MVTVESPAKIINLPSGRGHFEIKKRAKKDKDILLPLMKEVSYGFQS